MPPLPVVSAATLLWPTLDCLLAGLLLGPVLSMPARRRFALWIGACEGLAGVTGRLLPPHAAFTLPDWLTYLLAAPLVCAGLLGRRRGLMAIPVLLAFDNLLQPQTCLTAATEAVLGAALAWLGLTTTAALRVRSARSV